ncbi:MAG: hypothetical protein ACRDUY_03380 [Nitriliruptorales bacterium]
MEPGALSRWRAHLEEVMGVDDAAAIVDPFYTVDWANLATKDDLERFATKDDLERFATKEDLRRLEEELRRDLASKADVEAMGELLTERLTTRFRRELLVHSTGQFFALVLAIAALVSLG